MTDPLAPVAADLRAIHELAAHLPDQAAHRAAARTMPGGEALAALAPVANLEAYENRMAAAERAQAEYARNPNARTPPPTDHRNDEDDEDQWQARQLLRYWSEPARRQTNTEGGPLTIESEATWLSANLGWLYENETHWSDFAEDMHSARMRLEALLHDGVRTTHGVPCLSCGTDLVRPEDDPREPRRCSGHVLDGGTICLIPHAHCPHDRGGLKDEWTCPKCRRAYSVEEYRLAVSNVHAAHAEWLPGDKCESRTGVKVGTIRVWSHRGFVKRKRDGETGRVQYRVADIERHRDRSLHSESSPCNLGLSASVPARK